MTSLAVLYTRCMRWSDCECSRLLSDCIMFGGQIELYWHGYFWHVRRLQLHHFGSAPRGAGIIVHSAGFVIKRSWVRLSPGRGFLFQSQISVCADPYFGIRSTPVLPQQHVKDLGHSAKSAGGRLQLNIHANIHAPYVCGFEWRDTANCCMVVRCTQNVHWHFTYWRGTSHATTTKSVVLLVHHFGGYSKHAVKVTHSESHATRAQWVCSRAENSAI